MNIARHTRVLTLATLALLSAAPLAAAEDFSFVNWDTATLTPTSISGTIPTTTGLVSVTLTGGFTSVYLDDVYNPATSFVGGIVGNRPDVPWCVRIDNPTPFTLTFSRPVTNLAYALWSVGAPGSTVSYEFTQPFDLVATGPNDRFGGSALTQTGNTVTGQEGNGTLLFTGTYSSINWNVLGAESYQTFTIGLSNTQNVPEPSAATALAVPALALLRRRR